MPPRPSASASWPSTRRRLRRAAELGDAATLRAERARRLRPEPGPPCVAVAGRRPRMRRHAPCPCAAAFFATVSRIGQIGESTRAVLRYSSNRFTTSGCCAATSCFSPGSAFRSYSSIGPPSAVPDRLPVADPRRLVEAALVELPVQRRDARSTLPSSSAGRIEMPSRLGRRRLLAGQLGHRGQEVPERPDLVAHDARLDLARPARDGRGPEAPLVHVALVAAERAGVVEQLVADRPRRCRWRRTRASSRRAPAP